MPSAAFTITGKPAAYTYVAHNGNKVTRYFCTQCGINLYSDGEDGPGIKILKCGALDDPLLLNEMKPDMELFVQRRATWLRPVADIDQKEIM